MADQSIERDLFTTGVPDLSNPPGMRGENWHKQSIRHFCNFYNVRNNIFGSSEYSNHQTMVDQMKDNFSYVLGRQVNKDYAFVATDKASNIQDALGIVAGQKVAQIVEWMRGKFLQMITNMDLYAETISQDNKTKELAMFDKLMIKYLLKPELQDLAEQGVSFQPAGSFEPEIADDVSRFMARDFNANNEITAKDIANDLLQNNYYKQLFLQCATHVLAAGVTGVDCIVRNGKVEWDFVPAHLLIRDLGFDDDLNRKARFAGYISFKTPEEIFTRWNFTNDEKEDVKKLSRGETIGAGELAYNTDQLNLNHQNNFKWWNLGNNSTEVACVKMYWKCLEDAGYNKKVNKYGNTNYIPKDYKVNISDTTYEGWRQGVLIGNLFLKEYGPVPNQVGHIDTYVKSNCPLKIFMPGMIMGENRSVVDKLKNHQDRMDAYRRMVTDLASKSVGKGAIINGYAFGIKEGSKIVADLKRDGVTVVNFESGEANENGRETMDNFIKTVDLTADPNIKLYIDLMREEERQMEEIANIPKIAQGMQAGYTGAQVQSTTLAQSELGTSTLYLGFIDYCTYLVQYSASVAKFAMTADKDDYTARLKIGDYGYKFAKITRELRYEETQLWFKVQDVIDDQAKQRIRAYAQAFSQNPEWGVGPDDILRLEKARTWTEMITDLEYSIHKKKEEMNKKQAYEQMLAMVQQEQANKAAAERDDAKNMVSRANASDNAQAKILTKAMDQNPALAQ